jgi:hypothetical protein
MTTKDKVKPKETYDLYPSTPVVNAGGKGHYRPPFQKVHSKGKPATRGKVE